MNVKTLVNTIDCLNTSIECSKEELEFVEIFDQEDMTFVFDVNVEIVSNTRKLNILIDMLETILKSKNEKETDSQ